MAYSGTTAGTTLANPPRCIAGPALYGNIGTSVLTTAPAAPNAQGGNVWFYCSTNKTTDITADGFFDDGFYLGMRPGDLVIATQFTSAGSTVIMSMHPVATVNSTAGTASLQSTSNAAYYLSTTRASSI